MSQPNSLLTADLQLGPVEINVKDIANMKHFYVHVMGLDVLEEDRARIVLGMKEHQLLILHHTLDLDFSTGQAAGLYHFAIVFSSRGDLARTIFRIVKSTPHLFSGSGDHLVSEAFYFNDPEGNGIELYFDRDRASWQWKNGQIQMATLYIDVEDYLDRYIALEEDGTQTKIGHVHLKVGDIARAKQFYVEVLGFSITAELSSALFISVGGYHHHLGLNTWESYGAVERTDSLGLKNFELKLALQTDVDTLISRLKAQHVEFDQHENGVSFFDPWKNKITVQKQ